MRNRITSILLAALMLLSLLPVPSWAAEVTQKDEAVTATEGQPSPQSDAIAVTSVPENKYLGCDRASKIIPANCYVDDDGVYYVTDDSGSIRIDAGSGVMTARKAVVFSSRSTEKAELVSASHILFLVNENIEYSSPATGNKVAKNVNEYQCVLCGKTFYGSNKDYSTPETAVAYDYAYAYNLVKQGYVAIPANAKLASVPYVWADDSASTGGSESGNIIASGECGADGDNVLWTLDGQGVLTITGEGDMADYSSGETAPWYDYAASVQSVVIAEGVTHVGNRAFIYCSALTDASLSNSIESIGTYAFFSAGLSDIVIPQDVETIGTNAFSSCTRLESVKTCGNLWSVGTDCFSDCSALTEVVFGGYVRSVGGGMFARCTSLKSIVLPSNINGMWSMFQGCTSLTNVTLPDGITEISSSAFQGCKALQSLNLPDSVTNIRERAFSECTNLKDINFPDNLETIDTYAFYKCQSLTKIVLGEQLNLIDEYAFASCNAFEAASFTKSSSSYGTLSIGFGAFAKCSALSNVYYLGTSNDWGTVSFADDNDALADAELHYISTSCTIGNINGIDGIDATDMACLHEYLTSGFNRGYLSGKYLKQVADLNNDQVVDVYDLQLLYEVVSGLADIDDIKQKQPITSLDTMYATFSNYPDAYAWIEIPEFSEAMGIDHAFSYPVAQHPSDRNYYLSHNLDGNTNNAGTIFSEATVEGKVINGRDLSDPVTVLYGRNMANRTMFGGLQSFLKSMDLNQQHLVYMYQQNRRVAYQIVGGVQYDTSHIIYYHDFSDASIFNSFFNQLWNETDSSTNVDYSNKPVAGDRVLILSVAKSNDDNHRYLIICKMIEDTII